MRKRIATVITLYAIIMHAAFATDRDLTFFKEINQATEDPGLNSDPIDGAFNTDQRSNPVDSTRTDRFKEINQATQDPGLNSNPIDGASNTEFDVSDYNATVNVSTGSKLNVRKGPATTHAIIGARYRGDTVQVTHHDGQWRKIAWSAGQIAYVHGNYLQSGSLDAATPDSSSENNTAGTSISTLSDSALQERIDNWPGTDNDPILDRLVSERNARLDVPTLTSGSGGGSRSSGSFADNTASTSISALSDSELQQRIDNWQGTDNDPILDRLVSEQNARLDVKADCEKEQPIDSEILQTPYQASAEENVKMYDQPDTDCPNESNKFNKGEYARVLAERGDWVFIENNFNDQTGWVLKNVFLYSHTPATEPLTNNRVVNGIIELGCMVFSTLTALPPSTMTEFLLSTTSSLTCGFTFTTAREVQRTCLVEAGITVSGCPWVNQEPYKSNVEAWLALPNTQNGNIQAVDDRVISAEAAYVNCLWAAANFGPDHWSLGWNHLGCVSEYREKP